MAVSTYIALCFWALGLAVGAQQPIAIPSNSSDFTINVNLNLTAILAAPLLKQDIALYPLTNDSFSILPNGPNTTGGNRGTIVAVNTNSSNTLNAMDIAYIPCDASAFPGEITLENVVDDATKANVTSIIFYSTTAPFCNLTGPLSNGYQLAYSTVDTQNATMLQQALAMIGGAASSNGGSDGTIFTQEAYQNALIQAQNGSGFSGSGSTTQIAMIILYSITGVITALFLVIIITGAVRAHRHPERYGPRAVLGRTRQNRAKGLARAMLDSIPIVKFGQEEEVTKPTDVELGSDPVHSTATTATATTNAAKKTTEQPKEGDATTVVESKSGPSQTDVSQDTDGTHSSEAATAATPAADSHSDAAGDNALGCSICTEDFEKGQDLRVLPCGHKFHPACVDPWLLDVSGTCPLCRVDLRPPEARQSSEQNREGEGQGQEQNGSELAPPLDPNHVNNRRRQLLSNFFDRRRLNDTTREERIATLRRFRQQQREQQYGSASEQAESQDTSSEERENQTRWQRVRRSLAFRSQPRQQ